MLSVSLSVFFFHKAGVFFVFVNHFSPHGVTNSMLYIKDFSLDNTLIPLISLLQTVMFSKIGQGLLSKQSVCGGGGRLYVRPYINESPLKKQIALVYV